VAAVLVGAAETGALFVQASAYGDERRLLLRPPYGYLAASVASWLVWVTALIAARQVAAVRLAELGHGASSAADLTGPTPGLAVEVRLREPATAVLARRPGETRGQSVDVPGLLVSPTRPGAALAEARRRGYP
jgi:hypothetical protein